MSIRVLLADDHMVVRQGRRVLLEREGMVVVGEAARELQRQASHTRCVLLTRHDGDQYVTEALRAGVRGYVLKSQAAGDLVNAIREVQRGQIYLSPGVSGALVEALLTGGSRKSDELSGREQQVLQLIGEGKATKEIASVLGISPKTAESHRGRLMRKLDMDDTASLVRYAIRQGLIEP